MRYYTFMVKKYRCNASNGFSNRICGPNEIEDINLLVFNMIARKNESKTVTNKFHDIVNLDLMVENII